MNPILDPFTPGSGMAPPAITGRDELRETLRIAMERARIGRPTRSAVMIGLRGVGKTALLDGLRADAHASGLLTLLLELREGRTLPALLMPPLREVLQPLARHPTARDATHQALRVLASTAQRLRPQYRDIDPRLALSTDDGTEATEPVGILEHDLELLLECAGRSAKAAGTLLVLFVDELQVLEQNQLNALLSAMQHVALLQLPVMLVGAGLPPLKERMLLARPSAARMYDFPVLGRLAPEAARRAILDPVESEGVHITDEALELLLARSQRHPLLLQHWGSQAWRAAAASPIDADAVRAAEAGVNAALGEEFYGTPFERLAPKEKRYLRAMAELGPGPHRSGDIAACLSVGVSTLAVTRAALIQRGLAWSPHHGQTAFTLPLMDEFLKRAMPGDGWLEEQAMPRPRPRTSKTKPTPQPAPRLAAPSSRD